MNNDSISSLMDQGWIRMGIFEHFLPIFTDHPVGFVQTMGVYGYTMVCSIFSQWFIIIERQF